MFRRITAGIEGKIRHASIFSRCGDTAATTCGFVRSQKGSRSGAQTAARGPGLPQGCQGQGAHFVSKLLDENEGGDKNVGLGAIALELGVVGLVTQLLEEVANNLESAACNSAGSPPCACEPGPARQARLKAGDLPRSRRSGCSC